MADPDYRITLEALEQSVHVKPEDVIAEHDVTPPQDPDAYDQNGHLPGNVRPYGA